MESLLEVVGNLVRPSYLTISRAGAWTRRRAMADMAEDRPWATGVVRRPRVSTCTRRASKRPRPRRPTGMLLGRRQASPLWYGQAAARLDFIMERWNRTK